MQGIAFPLINYEDISLVITRFIKTLKIQNTVLADVQISLPEWDSLSRDLTLSITMPYNHEMDYSILGVSLYFSSIVEDITYFNNYPDYFYAFMIDLKGK